MPFHSSSSLHNNVSWKQKVMCYTLPCGVQVDLLVPPNKMTVSMKGWTVSSQFNFLWITNPPNLLMDMVGLRIPVWGISEFPKSWLPTGFTNGQWLLSILKDGFWRIWRILQAKKKMSPRVGLWKLMNQTTYSKCSGDCQLTCYQKSPTVLQTNAPYIWWGPMVPYRWN